MYHISSSNVKFEKKLAPVYDNILIDDILMKIHLIFGIDISIYIHSYCEYPQIFILF